MKPIVVQLVDYVETNTAYHGLKALVDRIGAIEVRIVAIKILGWLKKMARRGKHQPVRLNPSYPWCQNFAVLMSELPELRELVEVKGNCIEFCTTISAEERVEILEYVDTHHCPPLRTSQPKISHAKRSYGMLRWKGSDQELDDLLGPDNHPWATQK